MGGHLPCWHSGGQRALVLGKLAISLLVVRPGAIGDALLALPALAAIRRARSGASLTFLAHGSVGELVLAEGLVDRFIPRDGPEADALFASTSLPARQRLGAIEAAVAWTADVNGRLAANLAALAVQTVVIAPSRPEEGSGKHVAQHLLDTLAPLGIFGSADQYPGLLPARGSLRPALVQSEAGPTIVLHPGSGSPRKNWPADRFAALGERLRDQTGARLVVLAGHADERPLQVFTGAARVPFSALSERPLRELVALLARCDLYVGNDSGMSHLAGISGAPTIALFGPTDPGLWRPLGPRVAVIRRDPLDSLSVEDVAEVAMSRLARTSVVWTSDHHERT